MKRSNLNKLIKQLNTEKRLNRTAISSLKRKYAAKFSVQIPQNSELLQAYHKLLKNKKLVKNPTLERLLKKREIRTLSGVAPIAVLTKPYPCPGKCIYCPNEKNMPKSYLSNEPAVMRAILNKFDPYQQVQMRLRALKANGHPTDKCELIVMGGTWTCLPKSYQTNFIKRCFQAFNDFPRAQRKSTSSQRKSTSNKNKWQQILKNNERAQHKVVGLTLETRPDYITPQEIVRMRRLGCTRIEIGVQSIYDDILKLNQRGCTRQQIVDATRLLKDAGFKITYHMMPNLPGSTPARDLKMFKELFANPDFQPDQLKIYPCVVTNSAKINKWYTNTLNAKHSKKTRTPGRMTGPRRLPTYKPYSETQLTSLLIKIKKIIPPYVRITRLIRDIPSESIIAGNKISNLRQIIQQKMQNHIRNPLAPYSSDLSTETQKVKVEASGSGRLSAKNPKSEIRNPKSGCQCIRCREIRGTDYKLSNVKLLKRKYPASSGKEIFLSYEDIKQNKLIAFLRLRLPQNHKSTKTPQNESIKDACGERSRTIRESLEEIGALQNAAIIREIHAYGSLTPINKKGHAQHRGFGKKLIKEAEKLAKQAGYPHLAVISGIGVRDYYRKLGYHLQDEYMVKKLI